MEEVKIIEGIPLSVPKRIEGTFYWLDDYIRLDRKPTGVIIGNKNQDPQLLLYKDNVLGYLVQYGGFTSHLAIVGRELNIPVYRYDDLDKLVSGIRIIVVPKEKINIEIKDSLVWTIRNIVDDNVINKLDYIFHHEYVILSTLSKYFTIEKFKIEYDRNITPNIVWMFIKTSNMKSYFEKAIRDPYSVLSMIEKETGPGISFVCGQTVEVLVPYLMNEVGVEKTLRAIQRHTPYWFRASAKYLKVRFNITDEEIIKYLHSLNREKNEYIKLDEPYEGIAKLIAKCLEKYEEKNLEI